MTNEEQLTIDEALEFLGLLYDAYGEASHRWKNAKNSELLSIKAVEAIKWDVDFHSARLAKIAFKYIDSTNIVGSKFDSKTNSIDLEIDDYLCGGCFKLRDHIQASWRSLSLASMGVFRKIKVTDPRTISFQGYKPKMRWKPSC